MGRASTLLDTLVTKLNADETFTMRLLDYMDDERLRSGAITKATAWIDLDEESDGDFADARVPAVGLSMLLAVPVGTSAATARTTLSTQVDALRAVLNRSGLVAPARVMVTYGRGVLAGARCVTAALTLDWESI